MLQQFWAHIFLKGSSCSLNCVLCYSVKCGPACAQRPSSLPLFIPRRLIVPKTHTAFLLHQHSGAAKTMWKEGVMLKVSLWEDSWYGGTGYSWSDMWLLHLVEMFQSFCAWLSHAGVTASAWLGWLIHYKQSRLSQHCKILWIKQTW